jgi:hypothetical protein
LIHRAGKVFSLSADLFFVSRFCQQISLVSSFGFRQQIPSADFSCQQICFLSADSVSRFPSSAVSFFVRRFHPQSLFVHFWQIPSQERHAPD